MPDQLLARWSEAALVSMIAPVTGLSSSSAQVRFTLPSIRNFLDESSTDPESYLTLTNFIGVLTDNHLLGHPAIEAVFVGI